MYLSEVKKVLEIVNRLPEQYQEEAWTIFDCQGVCDKDYSVSGLLVEATYIEEQAIEDDYDAEFATAFVNAVQELLDEVTA